MIKRLNTTKLLRTLISGFIIMVSPSIVLAGAGHDHGESQFSGSSASNAFTLPQSTIDNLDIQSRPVLLEPMNNTTRMLAQVKLLPENRAIITPRFAGKVDSLFVKLGDRVQKDQKLVRINPLTVGSQAVTIKAPMSGILSVQKGVIGQIVQPGDMIMEVSDRSEVLIKGITYDIAHVNHIQVGQSVSLHIDAVPSEVFEGRVQRIDQSIDKENRTFSVYALVPNTNQRLIPNMQGSMDISMGSSNEIPVISVPTKAILGTLGQKFVYVMDGNHFEKRNLTLGVKKADRQEVINGVFPGEEVVIQGNYQLQYVTPEGEKAPIDDHGHAH